MDNYSPEAQRLLVKWNCMTKNMQAAIGRFKQLNEQAVKLGPESQMKLQLRLQEMGLSILYEKIGQRLRDFANSSGVEKLFPTPEEREETGGIARFVDFKIPEEALPEFDRCIDDMNELIITLTAKLCLIKL
jgi:hypothetical protein